MSVEGIAETVWAQKSINLLKRETDKIEAARDKIVAMKAVFVAKGIDISGTKLQEKDDDLNTLIDNISSLVDSVEVVWLNNNYNQSTRTTELE